MSFNIRILKIILKSGKYAGKKKDSTFIKPFDLGLKLLFDHDARFF